MIINGATVDDSLVPELARAIRNPNLAHKLQSAHRFRTELINLSHTGANAGPRGSRGVTTALPLGPSCTAGR